MGRQVIYAHYIKLKEHEEEILQDCMTVTDQGIKNTIMTALRAYLKQNEEMIMSKRVIK